MVNDIYGNDIDSSWSFTDGDLNIVKNKINLGQAILNRLKTDLGTYDLFYTRYGGNLFEQFGELNHPTIHEYIKIEVESILQQDPRIQNIECTVNKTYSNGVGITLNVTPITNDEVISYNLVLNDDSYITINNNMSEMNDRRD
jgi:hypothetical protein